jgi:hypothetical protein
MQTKVKFVQFTKYYSGEQIKEMGSTCSKCGQMRRAYKLVVGIH